MEATREDLSRVSVETVGDFERIKAVYSQLYLTKLEEEIRAQRLSGSRDALVAHAKYRIETTFELLQPNLRINGQQYASKEADQGDMEPFDEALDRQIWSLADSRLGWHKSLAETRRTVPREIEAALAALQAQQSTSFSEDMDVDEAIPEVELSVGDAVLAERYAKIEDGLLKATAVSSELDQLIPSQTERSQRFENVSADVKEFSTW
ncbi:hypothetical protein CPB85DRAFT_1271499 [Mucidula mucida]|nr:hypothetical protein CPB85DRAFT_1271499 [Mucidula mucida]